MDTTGVVLFVVFPHPKYNCVATSSARTSTDCSVVSIKNYCSVCGVFKGGVFLKRPKVAVTNCEIKYANDLAEEGSRFRIRIHENLLCLSCILVFM
jgi:hypothetical protein